jgi:hypothetical protein
MIAFGNLACWRPYLLQLHAEHRKSRVTAAIIAGEIILDRPPLEP